MRLHLHLGTPKTGTTSLQRWCSRHRDDLLRQGVLYPRAPGEVNHRGLWQTCVSPQTAPPSDRQDLARRRDELAARLADEVAQAAAGGATACLMSSEALWARLSDPEQSEAFDHLRAMLEPIFSEIELGVTLRPQVDLWVSNASQRARRGKPVSLRRMGYAGLDEIHPFYDYDTSLATWEQVFGQHRVVPTAFRRRPDTRRAVLGALGLDPADFPPATHDNPALGWPHIALANAASATSLPLPPLDDLPPAPPLQIGIDVATAFQDRYTPGNERLAERHADLDADDLAPDWSRYRQPPNLAELDEATAVLAPALAAIDQETTARLATRDRRLERLRRRHARLRQTTSQLEESLRELEAAQDDLAARHRDRRDEAQRHAEEARRARRELDDLRASTSWRATRPLRTISGILTGKRPFGR